MRAQSRSTQGVSGPSSPIHVWSRLVGTVQSKRVLAMMKSCVVVKNDEKGRPFFSASLNSFGNNWLPGPGASGPSWVG